MRILIPFLALLLVQDRPEPKKSERLQKVLDQSLKTALARLADEKWSTDAIAVTLVDLKNPEKPEIAEHRGTVSYYPASVVKMGYMAACFEWVRAGKLTFDADLERDLRDMIGPSSNKATQRIVDRLCGTADGPELEGKGYEEFVSKRLAVNRWLHGLGLKGVSACQKTYDGDEVSPRDQQFLRNGKSSGPFTNRNAMTTRDAARLLLWIATGRIVNKESCGKMLDLMKRDLKTYPDDARRALGGVPEGSKVWAKAGWVDNEWHEAALVELPDGRRFILVVFTTGRAYQGPLIAEIARAISSGIR